MPKCPHCHFDYAYVSLLKIECARYACKFFSEKARDEYQDLLKKEREERYPIDLENDVNKIEDTDPTFFVPFSNFFKSP